MLARSQHKQTFDARDQSASSEAFEGELIYKTTYSSTTESKEWLNRTSRDFPSGKKIIIESMAQKTSDFRKDSLISIVNFKLGKSYSKKYPADSFFCSDIKPIQMQISYDEKPYIINGYKCRSYSASNDHGWKYTVYYSTEFLLPKDHLVMIDKFREIKKGITIRNVIEQDHLTTTEDLVAIRRRDIQPRELFVDEHMCKNK